MPTNAEYLAQGKTQQEINLAIMSKKLGQKIKVPKGNTGINPKAPIILSGKATPIDKTINSNTPPVSSNVPTRTQKYVPGQTTADIPVKEGLAPTGTVLNTLGAYNPRTGGYETINPTVGVNTGEYSPEAKQKLWADSGNAGTENQDAFYRKEDGTLGIKPEFVKNTNPNTMGSVDEINAWLNGKQNTSFVQNGGNVSDTSLISADVNAIKGTAPVVYNSSDDLAKLRATYGIDNLEGQISELDKQEQDLIALNRQRKQAEQDKPIAMGVIGGRMSEIDRQANEQLDYIGRQKTYITSQLQAKNSVIQMTMEAHGNDYARAKDSYDSELAKNIQLISLTRGLRQDQITEQDKIKDDARAVITTMYNQFSSGGVDPRALPPLQQQMIAKMEMQAGLPVGFSQQIYDKNPQSTIVSTSHSTDVTGNDYADVITQNTKTGEMKLNKIYIGKSADQANKEADLKIKATEAETARIKALKTTVPEDQEKKDKTAQEKKDYALQKNFATDASKQVEKIRLGTTDFDTAHAILFTKYSSELAKKGYSDAEIKSIIHKFLGGK